jgi:hypothetical protein
MVGDGVSSMAVVTDEVGAGEIVFGNTFVGELMQYLTREAVL